MIKTCKSCRSNKNVAEFYISHETFDGYRTECKACNSEKRKAAYQKNREAELLRNAAWNFDHPEKMRAANKKYTQKLKDEKRKNQSIDG